MTGASGFIGHKAALHLKENGFAVLAIVPREKLGSKNVTELRDGNVTIVEADGRFQYRLPRSAGGSEALVHCEGAVGTENSGEETTELLRKNTVATGLVAEGCVVKRIRRLVFLSSAAVYGNTKLPSMEDDPKRPVSAYGLSKLLAEEVLKFQSSRTGLEVVLLRPFNVYGRCEATPSSSVVDKFASLVSRGRPPIIFGTGRQKRDFVHIDDLCRAVELSLTTKHINQAYNIGTGKGTSLSELASLTLRLGKLRLRPTHKGAKQVEVENSIANVSKAKRLLGFATRTSLTVGLQGLLAEAA